eukprot:scaffold1136_cov399-Prasinococcus_capsulatus_cf.AAC.14
MVPRSPAAPPGARPLHPLQIQRRPRAQGEVSAAACCSALPPVRRRSGLHRRIDHAEHGLHARPPPRAAADACHFIAFHFHRQVDAHVTAGARLGRAHAASTVHVSSPGGPTSALACVPPPATRRRAGDFDDPAAASCLPRGRAPRRVGACRIIVLLPLTQRAPR